MANKQIGSSFQVKLSGIKLPAEVEKRIEGEIRKTVMIEIAKLDLKGDLRLGRLGPGLRGFILQKINIR